MRVLDSEPLMTEKTKPKSAKKKPKKTAAEPQSGAAHARRTMTTTKEAAV